MKLNNLYQFYRMTKNWDLVEIKGETKISIPDTDLSKIDIRDNGLVLKDDFNPNLKNARGVFLPDMSEDDYAKFLQQKSGWQKFYDKVKKL